MDLNSISSSFKASAKASETSAKNSETYAKASDTSSETFAKALDTSAKSNETCAAEAENPAQSYKSETGNSSESTFTGNEHYEPTSESDTNFNKQILDFDEIQPKPAKPYATPYESFKINSESDLNSSEQIQSPSRPSSALPPAADSPLPPVFDEPEIVKVEIQGRLTSETNLVEIIRKNPQIIGNIAQLLAPRLDQVVVRVNIQSFTWDILTKNQEAREFVTKSCQSNSFFKNLTEIVQDACFDDVKIKEFFVTLEKEFDEVRREALENMAIKLEEGVKDVTEVRIMKYAVML